jgi:hypothetical protein
MEVGIKKHTPVKDKAGIVPVIPFRDNRSGGGDGLFLTKVQEITFVGWPDF